MLVFEIDGMIFVRRHNYGFTINGDEVVSKWSPFEGIEVETKIIPQKWGHKREHTIISEYECKVYECGFAAAARDKDEMNFRLHDDECEAFNKFAFSAVRSSMEIPGEAEAIKPCAKLIHAAPNTNIFYNKTVIPAAEFKIGKGKSVIKSIITSCAMPK